MLEEVKKDISEAVAKAIKRAPHEIAALLEVPKDKNLGDFALPCFKLKTELSPDPIAIAKDIYLKLQKPRAIEKIQLAGPYVNFFVDKNYLASKTIFEILELKENFGSGSKKSERVMIEGFGQPNTHKAFHIGHFRNVCLSDALARILRFYGYDVLTANYFGDIGMHVAKWLWFYLKFYKGKLPKSPTSEWFGKIYTEANKFYEKHEESHQEVSNILNKIEFGKDAHLKALWKSTRDSSLKTFSEVYKKIGVKTDVIFYESKLSKIGKSLTKKLVKEGVAKLDQGAIIVDLKKYGLGVLVLLKSDGGALYSTRDLALAFQKFTKYKIDKSIYVVAAEQSHYFKQLFKTLELAGFKQAKNCHHVPYGLVLLHGKKMASRAGEVVAFEQLFETAKKRAVQEILKRNKSLNKKIVDSISEKIALAALKFAMLKQSSDKTIDFDLNSMLSFEGETGPYLLYSLVRARNILKKARIKIKKNFAPKFEQSYEIDLVKKLCEFREIVSKAAVQYAPHIIANYAYDLAKRFSEFYENCPVIKEKGDILQTRIALVQAFFYVLRTALNLLGIEEITKM
jgi:arginyl-tRNA synthetase